MKPRRPHTLSLPVLLLLAGCGADDAPAMDPRVPGPGGALGVCCAPGPRTCSVTFLGGWAEETALCDDFDFRYARSAFDTEELAEDEDEWGCPTLRQVGFTSCLPPPPPPDMGPDTGLDRGYGVACRTSGGCRVGVCQPELPPPVPTPGDPPGRVSPRFPGGFCTLDGLAVDTPDCLRAPALCGDFMTCREVPGFPGQGACFLRCDPSAEGNDLCRDGWACRGRLGARGDEGACVDGCLEDADCAREALVREETNGIPGLQSEADCAAEPSPCGEAGADELVVLGGVDPRCNLDAFACEVDGDPRAQAGDRCQVTAQCEDGGACRRETRVTRYDGDDVVIFPGGSCFGPGCVGDAECNGEGRCGGARSGAFLTGRQNICLAPCTLGVDADPEDPASWPASRGGCAEGYKCLSNTSVADPGRGVCVPDSLDPFRDLATPTAPFASGPEAPNLGAPCTRHSDCFHPFGYGRCLLGANGRDGVCSVDEAGILRQAGFDVCEAGAIVGLDGSPGLEQRCLLRCATPADCGAGFGCIPRSGRGTVCAPSGCTLDAQCAPGTRCLEGACHTPCAEASACEAGLGCFPLTALGGARSARVCFAGCRSNADCAAGATCRDASVGLGRCIGD